MQHLLQHVPRLANQHVMVIGDVILDEYLIGQANRLSREAPIPVLEFERRDHIPGGGANPSMNIAALGSQAVQVGVVGQDAEAAALREILTARGIDTSGLIADPTRPTTTKTRVMAQMGLRFPQQVARIDRIERRPVSGEVEWEICAAIAKHGPTQQAILCSDYLTGLLTPAIVDEARRTAQASGILITADAQGELDKYAGVDLVKCNAEEAERYTGRRLYHNEDFEHVGRAMVERLGLRGGMLITRGSEGITLVLRGGEVTHLPAAHVEDVYDTVGAGDTVLAVVTLALAAKLPYTDAALLANFAAGIVIRKVGNYTPSPRELMAAITEQNKA